MNNYADRGGSAEVDNPLLDLHNSAKTENKSKFKNKLNMFTSVHVKFISIVHLYRDV